MILAENASCMRRFSTPMDAAMREGLASVTRQRILIFSYVQFIMTTLMIARVLNNSVRTSALRIQTALDAHVSRDVIWDAFNTWPIAVIVLLLLLLLLVVVETF